MTRFRSTSLARATHGRWCILGRSVPHGTGIPALFGLAVVLFLASVTVTLQSGAQEAEIPGPPDAPTSQPVVFSHRLHVTDIGLDCQFCHAYARRGPVAGLPSVARCAGCHNVVLPGNPEIERVLTYAENERPIPWVRVHSLPAYVRFTHKRHVRAGVGCDTCHGDVAHMEVVEQVSPLTMGWCVSCHKERQASVDCLTCHY